MQRREFLGRAIFGASALVLTGFPSLGKDEAPVFQGAEKGKQRPNILLITADDLGCQLSCYGEKRIATPQLDAFAAEGVRFASAYVAQSSCSPSRSALLTGLFPHQNGQLGLAHLGFQMYPGQKTLPALLKAAGYRTGIIGKLHVEPVADFPWDWLPKEKVAAVPTRDVKLVAQRAREFLADAKQTGQPFFFYVNYFDPHGPLNKDTDQINGLPEKPLRAADIKQPLPFRMPTPERQVSMTAQYFNTVLRLDAGLKLLLDELQAAGCAANTLVIYVGDNGIAAGRGKTWSYELGVQVPMLLRWPGVAQAGVVRNEPVSLLDVMPTVLAAAGVPAPVGLSGQPLQPLLRSGEAKWREFLFTEMNFHEPQIFRPQRTVRDARHKLVLNLLPEEGQAPRELFDLTADPDETHNLYADSACADVRSKLEKALAAWQRATNDPLLDLERVKRWKATAEKWSKLPKVKAANAMVVHIPPGELDLLK